MPDSFAERRQRLAQIAKAQGLGTIALVPGANFSYISGLHFHLMERPTLLFVTADNQILAIIPELEREKWTQAFPTAQTLFWQDSDGASFEGYNADITRTFFCQSVSAEHAAIYDIVRSANEKGREISGPDLTAHDLDVAVTAVLAASPFAGLIVHKTGHGLGLDIHEAPQIMKGNPKRLIAGTVFTIEPGLYRPGDIGVRIEDNVVILDSGVRSLTRFPRELMIMGV